MKKLLILVAILLVSSGSYALDTAKPFRLKDYNNKERSLSDYNGAKFVVVMFIATRCPVSNAYNERMVQLQNDYAKKGVVFLGINSNKEESVDEIRKHAKEHNFKFPVLKDVENVVADQFGASVTPEIYVLNPEHKVLYHGRIDDSRRENEVTSNDLRTALDELLSGKNISNNVTKAFGCTIKRIDKK
ncbi:thioredoxin family protein [candidate division KSB1 bacterium]|nr:thioredoxin family protein [candidate division KSB1 bacterium]